MLKLEGKLTNREITSVQGVSTRRVQQLYNKYKRHITCSEKSWKA
ncbi:MAG: hypothetical protein RXR51_02965 [Nitrososphaeria archaeon]